MMHAVKRNMFCSESTSCSGGSEAERLERWTCNPEAPSSSPALTAVNRELKVAEHSFGSL